MLRLVILAILAVGILTQVPQLAGLWGNPNGKQVVAKTSSKPTPAKKSGFNGRSGRVTLKADASGHFVTRAYINNKPIRVVVDTGATMIALTHDDARKLGVRPRKSDYTIPVRTANGTSYVAPVTLRSVRIGQAEERNIQAAVAPKGALHVTLLGMSYLKELRRFEIRQGKLILEN